MAKKRLDELVIERHLVADRKAATALILRGVVLVDEQRIDKPGTAVDCGAVIRIKGEPADKYVSRGGLKLEAALKGLHLEVPGKVCLDLGASTGGFTDCLLQHGARRVYAFDVGRGQLHWKLQQDPRVVVRDDVNVRYLTPAQVGEPAQLITVDLSFISLRKVLPALKSLAPVQVLALIKPQFEAPRHLVEKGGVIRDESLRLRIIGEFRQYAVRQGWTVQGELNSPLPGQKGNREHFLLLRI